MEKEEVCWLITTKCNQKCKYCHSFLNIADLTYEENKEHYIDGIDEMILRLIELDRPLKSIMCYN